MNPLVGVALIWALFGVWAYGRSLAYWQGRFPEQREWGDVGVSLAMGVMGPFGLLVAIPGGGDYGLQFWPRKPVRHITASTMVDVFARHFNAPRMSCPSCGHQETVMDYERINDSVNCTHCQGRFRYSTGEKIELDLGDDEPDWSEPSASDLAWAQATMPGKASGHTVGWRLWWAKPNTAETTVDGATTARLASLSDAELCAELAKIQSEIIEVRQTPPYILQSGNDARWEPQTPLVGYFHDGMPRAHGAGIYALKERPDSIGGANVIGRVALWGPVVEHSEGYRARYAYPLELWCDDEDMARALARHYGVTCHAELPEEVVADWYGQATGQLRAQRLLNQQLSALAAAQQPRVQQNRFGGGLGGVLGGSP